MYPEIDVLDTAVSCQVSDPDRPVRPAQRRPPGHPTGPAARSKTVVLRDGSPVLIRPIQAGDGPLVADVFARLSDTSRWMQFLAAKKELSPAELRYLTEIDHRDHEALAAVDPADGRGVGIARYIRHVETPQAAEVAVTVVDDWQRRGVGTELLSRLTGRAVQEGIGRFTAVAAADNVAAIGLLRAMSAELVHLASDTVEYEFMLASPREPSGSPGAADLAA